ncbi:MAG: ABC transporter permease [Bacilli bacterium]
MKITNKLVIERLKKNKNRSLGTLFGITLSSIIVCCVFSLLMTFRLLIIDSITMDQGPYYAFVTLKDSDDLNELKKDDRIEKLLIQNDLGYADNNLNIDTKPYYEVSHINNIGLDSLDLVEGKLPTNDKEVLIPKSMPKVKIGDKLKVNIGKVYDIVTNTTTNEITNKNETNYINNSDKISFEEDGITYEVSQTLENTKEHNYIVVGTYKSNKYDKMYFPYYTLLSYTEVGTSLGITTKNPKDIYNFIEKDYEENFESYDYNTLLLFLNFASKNDNDNLILLKVGGVISFIVMIVSILVIYNAFAMTFIEQKKLYGILRSLGSTKKQIRQFVYKEGLFLCIIGIPLGIFLSIFGINVALYFINNHISIISESNMSFKFVFNIYIVILTIVSCIITVFISSLLPAYRASKISPIEALTGQGDVKISKKKIKAGLLSKNIFGEIGVLASKNYKRSKSKYRITSIAIVMSILLFMIFNTFFNYIKTGLEANFNLLNFNYYVESNNNKELKIIDNSLNNSEYIKDYLHVNRIFNYEENILDVDVSKLTDIGKTAILELDNNLSYGINILTEESMKKILNQEGLKYSNFNDQNNPRGLYVNNIKQYFNKKHHIFKLFKKDISSVKLNNKNFEMYSIKNNYTGIENYNSIIDINIYITKDIFEKMFKGNIDGGNVFLINTTDSKGLTDELKNINENIVYEDISIQLKLMNDVLLIIGVFVYGFIIVISFIGIINIYNTINSNIILRKREIMILRSVGMTNKQMKTMIIYETFLFTIKAIVLSIPLTFAFTYLIHILFSETLYTDYKFPFISYGLCIALVFILVYFVAYLTVKHLSKNGNIISNINSDNL